MYDSSELMSPVSPSGGRWDERTLSLLWAREVNHMVAEVTDDVSLVSDILKQHRMEFFDKRERYGRSALNLFQTVRERRLVIEGPLSGPSRLSRQPPEGCFCVVRFDILIRDICSFDTC